MFVSIKARGLTDETNVYTEIPALLTASGILEPLIDYFLHRSHDRSLEWMRKVTRSIRLFLEYLQVNPAERDPHRLFQNFAQRLYTGTFNRETGIDTTGLCWLPRSPHDAARIVTHLTDFFNWLGEIRPEASTVNPRYAGGAFDRQTDEAAYQYRRSKAFLGHTWASNATPRSTGHRLRYRRLPKIIQGEPPAFPEDRFEDLLFKGFRTGDHFDYRGILITLLLHGAGFRESEPFHIYVQDVFPDPANVRQAKVLIHHPHYGAAPSDWWDPAMHEICRRHQESGFHDFSLPTIGRFAEAEGILKGRVLYNAQSADYRTLVSAWAAFVGQPAPQAPKPLASHEYLMRIHDPAIRSIMQTIIGERDKLKAEVNLLKSNTQVVVDRRPVGVRAAGAAASLPGTMFGHHEQLTPSEREALQKAVSADHLEKQGLREGTHGEILNERGRTVFDIGFARAIRKVLGN